MKLKDYCIVVTGAGSGIGRACAIELAKRGASIVVADINEEKARETLGSIREINDTSILCRVDVSNPDAVQSLVEETVSKFSRIDALVNNAAIQVNKTIEDITVEEWNRQLSVNLTGVFLCSKFSLPYLKQTRGSIVNMSSVNGFYAEPFCAGYCATKAAIIGLTKAMAIDHGREGVRVNCICPGYIDAGLAEAYFQDQPDPVQARIEAGKMHALQRIGTPEEVAKAVFFLISKEASFITGSSLVVDGGFGSGMPLKEL